MKYIYILLMTVLVLGSCLEDKSNLDYHDIIVPDSVFITNLTTGVRVRCDLDFAQQYSVDPGEELQLEAEVFYQGDDEITYEWCSGNKLLSKEKELHHLFMADANECMLYIGRKKAGNAHCYQFNVEVRDPYAKGVLVLTKENGSSLFDFVEYYSEKINTVFGGKEQVVSINKYVLRNDVYMNCNDGAQLEGRDPLKVFRYSGYSGNVLTGVQIVDKDWKSSVSLNSENMEILVSMKDEFIDQPQNLEIADFISLGSMSYLLNANGQVYTRVNYDNGNPSTGKFSTFPLAYNDPNDIPDKGPIDLKVDKFFFGTPIQSKPIGLAYEKERKRFLILAAANMGGMNQDYSYITDFSRPKISGDGFPDNYIDLNNFDKNLLTVIIPEQYGDDTYFIFKDNGKYWIQYCKIGGSMWNEPYDITNEPKSCKDLDNEISALLDAGGNYFQAAVNRIFFSSGSKIYSMSYSGLNLKMEYESPGTSPITKFSIMKPWEEGSSSPLNRYFKGRMLSVAFENGDFKVVKVYDDPDIPNVPQYENVIEKHYNGEVIDVFYYSM